jgi:DNA recombination protein RmuC
MDAAVIAVVFIAFAVGGLIGWLLGSRAAAASKQVIESLRLQLDEVVKERDANRSAAQDLVVLKAAQEERERAFEQQIQALREAKESLSAQFHEIGSKFLGEARKQFLEQAEGRFTQAMQPVQDILKRYEEGLQRVEKERVDQYAGLREAVELVRTGQGQVRDETRHLVNALRASPKARGRWGEQSLKNVLEQAGLSPYADFLTEVSVDGEEGKLRPDVIVRLPGGRKLVIDAKCSLNSYLDACDEVDDEQRPACFRAHVASMRNHAQQLGS